MQNEQGPPAVLLGVAPHGIEPTFATTGAASRPAVETPGGTDVLNGQADQFLATASTHINLR